ncbi:MAG: flippase-like domain-containing protein [Flavobacteriales bacterium]|nr:flippase-like domain-containing protein [Flavobacteriales bacterium]
MDEFISSLNQNQKNLIFYSITLVVCLLLLDKVEAHLYLFSKLNLWHLLILFCFDLIFLIVHSLQHYHIFTIFKKGISLLQVSAITAVSCLYNQLLPYQGSSFVKGTLVKKRIGISWTDVIVAIGGFYVFSNIALGLIVLLGSGLIFWDLGLNKQIYLFFIGFLLVILLMFYATQWAKNRPDLIKKYPILSIAIKVLNRFDVFSLDYRKNIEVMVLQLLKLFVISLKLYTIFVVFGAEISFVKVFMVQSIIAVSLPITVTPGNLGIKEGILVLFASFLGVSAEIALMAGVLNRLISITSFTFGGSLGHIYLTQKARLKTSLNKTISNNREE